MLASSKFVLGGALFNQMSTVKAAMLLATAGEIGIQAIDTAPSYGNSESVLGRNSVIKNWQVSTKLGNPNTRSLSKNEIVKSVDSSLSNLNIEQIHTLFLHSMQIDKLSDEVFSTLEYLRTAGKILFIGYSGDGKNLSAALDRHNFDSIMATLNILDLSNLSILQANTHKKIYLKRVLCSGVFRTNLRLNLIDYFFGESLERNNHNNYKFRFKKLLGRKKLFYDYAGLFMNFALSLNLPARYLVGSTDTAHIKTLVKLENDTQSWSSIELMEHKNTWEKFSEKYRWTPII